MSIANEIVHVFLRRPWIEVKLPNFAKLLPCSWFRIDWQRIKSITDSVAAAKDDAVTSIDLSDHGRRPVAVKDIFANFKTIGRQKLASVTIQHDQAGRIGLRNMAVFRVHSVGCVQIKVIAVH